ncbi:MAG: (E)-4-hydroxy-3-methylbut-2-enyl-diphosphate synthase, partial [Planctomycetota bacterium]|nr:(E)-4-hydroxy-3-methylbut-2-enyl-diphosphate synthase [Planctomycetota bacterium]
MPITNLDLPPYVANRFAWQRRASRAVRVGDLTIGGSAPIVIQSMCTTPTQDVAATIAQCVSLAEAGCELIRITAPGVKDAKALGDIRTGFSAAGFAKVPLVADIHFMPAAAMEAIEHVEKVRINPGNFADKKQFATIDYSDADYDAELQRIHERFSPLAKRAKQLGRALRIGVNHGSLSDRIMNRYGDTPAGMVESALEFIRIAEDNDFRDLVISMKSSNPKVMVHAYRMLVQALEQHGEAYPLHLGVTEAGDGEDGRVKGAAGIGALLEDGLGDTIRVSLTEAPEAEVPVA